MMKGKSTEFRDSQSNTFSKNVQVHMRTPPPKKKAIKLKNNIYLLNT